ncbi:hypothetical protein ABZN20_04070 [Methylococcus sp. ANG]
MFKKISFGATVAGVHGVTKKHGTGQDGALSGAAVGAAAEAIEKRRQQ